MSENVAFNCAGGPNERLSNENMGIAVTQTLKEGSPRWDLPPRSQRATDGP